MARFDTTNIGLDNKMYSVIGKATTGGADDLVQVGMVGKIGEQIEDNIYEFLPLEDGDTEVFFLSTPEVDPDESKVVFNTLHGFRLELGQVADAVEYKRHNKFTIEETAEAIEGLASGKATKGGYLYAKGGKRKLQYKATLPDTETDKAILVAKIEMIEPATQGMTVRATSAKKFENLALNYNLLRCRVL